MTKPLDLKGKKFGRLKAVERVANNKYGRTVWSCICECGVTKSIATTSLMSGSVISCGCYHKEYLEDLKNKTKEERLTRNSWRGMKERCDNKNNHRYYLYGAKGITYCEEWSDFKNFLKDMGLRKSGQTLDRIDGSKGYSKSNCRWTDLTTQAYNQVCRGSSGVHGVRRSKNKKGWTAHISKNNVYHYLGTFESFEEAVSKRIEAEKRLYGKSKTEASFKQKQN